MTKEEKFYKALEDLFIGTRIEGVGGQKSLRGSCMKTFEVILTKSYIVRIKAEDNNKVKEYAELFTGDIQDISTNDDRIRFNFEIEDIDCRMNESLEVQEFYERN